MDEEGVPSFWLSTMDVMGGSLLQAEAVKLHAAGRRSRQVRYIYMCRPSGSYL